MFTALASLVLSTVTAEIPTVATTTEGQKLTLKGRPATVLVFVTTTCPIARAMQPTLKKLHQQYSPKGVQFISVQIDPTLEVGDVKTYAKEYEIPWPQSIDTKHALVQGYKATITPEAVLLDRQGKIVYQGRIDNTYPEIGVKKTPTTHELRDALAATLAGKKPKVSKTKPVGCIIPSLTDF